MPEWTDSAPRSGLGRAAGCGLPGLRFRTRGAGHARRAEHLVGLHEDAKRPILAPGIGMVHLGLQLVGVANLLEARLGRNAQYLMRVDLKAEERQGEAVSCSKTGAGLT